jgi:hypothetical protein
MNLSTVDHHEPRNMKRNEPLDGHISVDIPTGYLLQHQAKWGKFSPLLDNIVMKYSSSSVR